MAGGATLVFRSLSAIHSECSRLFRQASDIECRKERRRRLRKLQRHPTVRKCRIIAASAGYECGFPRDLDADELVFKYALAEVPSLRLELREFERRVLRRAREAAHFERWWRQLENSGNQHPDAYPYPDTADEVRRELDFRESDEYREMGKTYSWYLHRYDERPPFADVTTHGRCQSCREGLPVWRSCGYCAFAHFVDGCDGIYVRCMECWSPEHQRDLKEVTRCGNCGGPPSIVIERRGGAPEDTRPWFPDEDWD